MEKIKITSEKIKLDQFLKWADIVESGGKAKILIQAGKVKVNGEIEKRRSYKLSPGDLITITGTNKKYQVIKE
ncbi:MAG: RNA-binding S4 domain-containing protein [Bacillota bacterium]